MVSSDSRQRIAASIEESIAVKRSLVEGLLDEIAIPVGWIKSALDRGAKILAFGNGGSAADAQHFVAELIGRFENERASMPALALTTDSSVLTSLADDFGVGSIFARQVEALRGPGDVTLALSTSGRSANVLDAVAAARDLGSRTICLTGEDGAELAERCDLALQVPSIRTARIQEAHITIPHAIRDLVEGSTDDPPPSRRSDG